MPANEKFLNIVLTQAQLIKTNSIVPASSWSPSRKTMGSATSAFLTELESAGLVWAIPKAGVHLDPKENKTKYTMDIAIAVALFRYGVNRYTSTHPDDAVLYQEIMQQVAAFTIAEQNNVTSFLSVLTDILKRTKTFPQPVALIKDLEKFTEIFFSSFEKSATAFAALIKTDAFFEKWVLTLKENADILSQPIMTKALNGNHNHGLFIMDTIMMVDNKIAYTDHIFKLWLNLLKHDMISAFATPRGYNLLQHWANWDKQYVATKMIDLLHDELTPTIRARVFSLAYSTDPTFGTLTPLQILAGHYKQSEQTYEQSIIYLLENNPTLSIKNEKGPTWIEMLPAGINKGSCTRIIAQIPEQMKQELRERNIPSLMDQKLSQNMQAIDFWTQTLAEKLSEENYNLYQTIKWIAPKSFAAHAQTVQASIRYEKNYQCLTAIVSKSSNLPEPPARSSYFNSDPLIQFGQKVADLIRQWDADNELFLKTYYLTNAVLYYVKIALDPEAKMPTLEVKNDRGNQRTDDHLKNEIKQSIEKSLVYFAEKFVFHSDQKKMMRHFITLLNNIAVLLEVHNITFDEIVLKHPPSRRILKNIYLTLYVFDDGQLQQTTLYSAIKDDADIVSLARNISQIQNLSDEFGVFNVVLFNIANQYKNGSLTARANFGKHGNEFNRYCVNSILENWEYYDNKKDIRNNKKLILTIKCLLNIIDYRISSYMQTEDTYEKGFYRDHLNKELGVYPNREMAPVLQSLKPLFIAQINLSLKKIAIDHLSKDIKREESLKRYIFQLRADYQIEAQDLKELDDHAQSILDYLDVNNIDRLTYSTKTDNTKAIACIMKKHRDEIDFTIEDVEKIIDSITQITDYINQKLVFTLPYVKAALTFKKDQFVAIDVFFEKIYSLYILKYNEFTKLWSLCLQHGLTDKVAYKDKPFMFYYLYRTHGAREKITHLDNAILSKIVNTSYAYAYTGTFSLPGYKDSKRVKLNEKQYHHLTSSTFSPAVWSAFYHVKPPTDSLTVIEHLAINLLVPNSSIPTNLSLITKLLKEKLIKHVDGEHPYGTWLEILFVGMHQASDQLKDFVIEHILPYIPDETLHEIITTPQIRDRIAYNLLTQMDTFADYYNNNDMKTYELYMMLLLRASLKFSAHLTEAEDFITQLCKILLKFPMHSYKILLLFGVQYKDMGNLKEIIKDKIKTLIDTEPMIRKIVKVELYKTLQIKDEITNSPDDDQDANISLVEQVCVFIKNALFLTVSVFASTEDKDIRQFLAQFNDEFTDEMKEAVYASSQKSIAYLFLYAPHKWYSSEFRVGILDLLDQIAQKLDLDHEKLLPENTDVLTTHCLLAATKEKACLIHKQLALPAGYQFTIVNPALSTHIEPCVSDEQIPFLDQFVPLVIKNVTTYINRFRLTQNAMSAYYAKLVTNLKYEGNNAAKKEIFMQAIFCIIEYQLASYTVADHDRELFHACFKEPLLALQEKLQISELYKTQIFYEIVAHLKSITTPPYSAHAPKPGDSLGETLKLFIDVFGLTQFEHFDFKDYPATSGMQLSCHPTTALALVKAREIIRSNSAIATSVVVNNNSNNGRRLSNDKL